MSKVYPDYVSCVLKGNHNSEVSWCGKFIIGWAFQDLTHALLNAHNKGRVLICPECSAEIQKALTTGTYFTQNKTPVDQYLDICEELDKHEINPGRSYMSRMLWQEAHDKRSNLWNKMTANEREQATIKRNGKP